MIVDRDTILHGTGGVQFGANGISGLYYADDIALYTENEQNLQDIFHIADIFAREWGLKFNDNKSQVLSIGKRWNDRQVLRCYQGN